MSLLFHCICNTKSSMVMLIIVIMIAHIDMVIGDVHPWAKAMHDDSRQYHDYLHSHDHDHDYDYGELTMRAGWGVL